MSFASQGVGVAPHLMMEMIKTRAGIDMVHVPYKGSGAAIADVLGGPTMAQIIKPGTPVLFGGAPATFHMKTATSPMASCFHWKPSTTASRWTKNT